jgi:hypothetical protein
LLGDDVCPNYLISEARLELDQRDFFTAHELAQMVPLYGHGVYRKMLNANSWRRQYLPAALAQAAPLEAERSRVGVRRPIERLLSQRVFDAWERWELARLRRKLRPLIGPSAEVVCSPDQCKGHTGLHRRSVMARYKERLEELGLGGYFSILFREDAQL